MQTDFMKKYLQIPKHKVILEKEKIFHTRKKSIETKIGKNRQKRKRNGLNIFLSYSSTS